MYYPEGGVDVIERAAIREEVNARNREILPLPSRYDLSATTNVVRSPSSADCEDMQRSPTGRTMEAGTIADHTMGGRIAPGRTHGVASTLSSDDVQRVEATLNARVLASP
jgi:hypothetical protein